MLQLLCADGVEQKKTIFGRDFYFKLKRTLITIQGRSTDPIYEKVLCHCLTVLQFQKWGLKMKEDLNFRDYNYFLAIRMLLDNLLNILPSP